GCPPGSQLVFSVDGAGSGAFATAFADPAGAGGERIWYFASEPIAAARPWQRASRLGPEHHAGKYRVHLLVSAQPLSREAAVAAALAPALALAPADAAGAAPVIARATFDLRVGP